MTFWLRVERVLVTTFCLVGYLSCSTVPSLFAMLSKDVVHFLAGSLRVLMKKVDILEKRLSEFAVDVAKPAQIPTEVHPLSAKEVSLTKSTKLPSKEVSLNKSTELLSAKEVLLAKSTEYRSSSCQVHGVVVSERSSSCQVHGVVAGERSSCCQVHGVVASERSSCCQVHGPVASKKSSCCQVYRVVASKRRSCYQVHGVVASKRRSCCQVRGVVAAKSTELPAKTIPLAKVAEFPAHSVSEEVIQTKEADLLSDSDSVFDEVASALEKDLESPREVMQEISNAANASPDIKAVPLFAERPPMPVFEEKEVLHAQMLYKWMDWMEKKWEKWEPLTDMDSFA